MISIENGVSTFNANFDELTEESKVSDFCQVMISDKRQSDKYYPFKSTYETIFPARFLIESIKSQQTITVGKLIEKKLGYKTGSWHEHFGEKITRHEMIYQTILDSFRC